MTFTEMPLSQPIQKALLAEGYSAPTPIQAQAIPQVLEGKDLIGCAQTGTGKTAAFALPILELLSQKSDAGARKQGAQKKKEIRPVRALILSPTRELAQQIGDSFTSYGRFTGLKNTVIYGGVSQHNQARQLSHGVDILVATPGRLLDLMNQRIVSLNEVQIVVLDEADHMLDMGFIHDIKKIISTLPEDKQALLFSATMPPEIANLANQMLKNPVRVQVSPVSSTAEPVQQHLYFTDRKLKTDLLLNLMDTLPMTSVLVFTRTKHGADKVMRDLSKAGVPTEVIHGDKAQSARQRALNRFKARQSRVLVATDIAARGIDVEELPYVVNYDLPDAAETYVHRIGRTGRAGTTGIAISFCSHDEKDNLRAIRRIVGNNALQVKEADEHKGVKEQSTRYFAENSQRMEMKKQIEPPILRPTGGDAVPVKNGAKGLSPAAASLHAVLNGKKKLNSEPEISGDVQALLSKTMTVQEEIALKLKAEGVDNSIIQRATGISREKLLSL
jgi:ATP-dependent RNA helicase RhlE